MTTRKAGTEIRAELIESQQGFDSSFKMRFATEDEMWATAKEEGWTVTDYSEVDKWVVVS